MTRAATIRYLDAAAVRRCLPPPSVLVDLAEVALRSLVAGADVPEKAALRPGPSGVFGHAMPARLTGTAVAGSVGGPPTDLLGMKWVTGGARNRAAGLPALAALIVLNDPGSGAPTAVLEGGVITAARTAALSGVAVRLLRPRAADERTGGGVGSTVRTARAVIVGAGAQGWAHAEMLGTVLPGVEIAIHDRHPERAADLARAAAGMAGVAVASAVRDPSAALRVADVVVTATALESSEPVLGAADVPAALVIPVDYAAFVSPELVRAAVAFVVDDRERFEANRRSGRLAGWPDPSATLGELLLRSGSSAERGLTVALHQGPAVADLLVSDAVLRRALALGVGLDLPA